MKRLLLILSIVSCAICSNAQTFKFCCDGKEITNGERIDITSMHTIEYGSLIFDPKLTFSPSQSGNATLTVDFSKSETSPELSGGDMFGYDYGVGNPVILVCSQGFVGQCVQMSTNQTKSFNASFQSGTTDDLHIQLSYTAGWNEPNIDNLNIDAEFSVKLEMGGQSCEAILFVKQGKDGITGVTNDNNAEVEYFDMQGRKINNPASGLYIRRQGTSVSKVRF